MKDIHSHILFDIDDGAESIDESIEILKDAISNHYTDIILTPHYRKSQKFVASNLKKLERFKELQEEVKKQKIKINLYLGNEITVDEDLFYYLSVNEIMTLNNSRYLLLELPFVGRIKYLDDFLEELLDKGYIPIIPHPERYKDYKEEDFRKWVSIGVLFQGNMGSLYGNYGKKAKTKLENMLKQHMIHFLGSDIHKSSQTTYEKDVIQVLDSLVKDHKMSLELTDLNIDKVIHNKEIKPYEVLKEEKKFKLFNR